MGVKSARIFHESSTAAAGEPPNLSRIVPVIQKFDWLAKYKLDCPYYALPDDLNRALAEIGVL